MEIFHFLKIPDINRGVKEYRSTPGAILLDVRTEQEYQEGHIAGSKNVPLQTIGHGDRTTDRRDTPLYVYCYSGARSRQAVTILQRMGYTHVKNIGGIAAWTGKVEY